MPSGRGQAWAHTEHYIRFNPPLVPRANILVYLSRRLSANGFQSGVPRPCHGLFFAPRPSRPASPPLLPLKYTYTSNICVAVGSRPPRKCPQRRIHPGG